MGLGVAFTTFWTLGAVTAVVLLVALYYAVRVTWPLTHLDRRAAAWPAVRAALIGGLLFTSSPFWTLLWPLVDQWHRYLPSSLFEMFLPFLGSLRFKLSWLPHFVFGYAVFGYFYKRWGATEAFPERKAGSKVVGRASS